MSKKLRFNGLRDLQRRAFVESLPTAPIDSRAEPFRPFSKIGLTFAAKVNVPFEVSTIEGVMEGKAGDYLAVGVQGEMYPIDADIMELSYKEVSDDVAKAYLND
jgi:hypothetical protein